MFVRYWLMKLVRNLQRSNVGACVYCQAKAGARRALPLGWVHVPPTSALWPPCWGLKGLT